jgi:bacterioferritin-associated ferredoxin
MNTCQLCGNQTAGEMFDVLPWGATCAPCVDEIKEARK